MSEPREVWTRSDGSVIAGYADAPEPRVPTAARMLYSHRKAYAAMGPRRQAVHRALWTTYQRVWDWTPARFLWQQYRKTWPR